MMNLINLIKLSTQALIKQANYYTIFFFILLSFILLKCANQLPPTGGDVDRIPPEIEEVYPADGTTNYDEDYFEIDFSEYVDKRSVREAVFISPFIEGALDFSWTGTSVEVSFPEGLKEDVTYTITIGTDVVDRNNNNRMLQSYSFSFSTGDRIDRKIISGKIFGKEKEGIFLYAYKVSKEADTLLISKPDYVSQSGKNGSYTLNGLASGIYRVFAVNDKFKDLLYQQDQDEIGLPYKDVILSDEDSIFTNLNFLLFNADTTRPRLISSVMTDKNHLLVTFNKALRFEDMNSENFVIFDSTASRGSAVKYFYKGKTKPEEAILVIDEELNIENKIILFADTLVDLSGNLMVNDFTKIILSDRPDTSGVRVISSEPNQNALIDFKSTQIKIFLDDAVRKDEIRSAITFADTLKNSIPFKLDFYDDATLLISPLLDLKPEKDYQIKLNMNSFIDAAGNSTDTLYTLMFKTISGLDFTGLSGKIIENDTSGIDLLSNLILVLENSENDNLIYKKKISSENFEFTRIEPGKYILWGFSDEDESGVYNFGYPDPFEYSEKFYFYPDTLSLKPRWEITDLQFRLK